MAPGYRPIGSAFVEASTSALSTAAFGASCDAHAEPHGAYRPPSMRPCRMAARHMCMQTGCNPLLHKSIEFHAAGHCRRIVRALSSRKRRSRHCG